MPVRTASTGSLLDVLRDEFGRVSVKDGCSPQGQCGCCTVWVDSSPRVACVTAVGRVAGRSVTTLEGLAAAERWAAVFAEHGASQCGFCTPGIIMRMAALDDDERADGDAVRRTLLAHLCRCTGWQPILEAVAAYPVLGFADLPDGAAGGEDSSWARAAERARVEGGVAQDVGASTAAGRGGFADDLAPRGISVALRRHAGDAVDDLDAWVVADDLAAARRAAGKVPGRRTSVAIGWPLEIPPGEWDRVLRTTWVEPAYLEPDASWCAPGGGAASPLGNGGAFGAKAISPLPAVAAALATREGRAVRALWSREDVVRFGPKRPPMAIGLRADGTGVARVVRTPGIAAAIASVAPGVEVVEVDVPGPATSVDIRCAGWAELAIMISSLGDGPDVITSPAGARAAAVIDDDGRVRVDVDGGVDVGDPLEVAVARSYAIGAVHMALGWVRSEGLSVDDTGEIHDLTIRSFGVLRAVDMPEVVVEFVASGDRSSSTDRPPMTAGSEAVFAAVAAAAWRRAGFAPEWPLGSGS